jgi:antitoxin (DNA-binding transcriptional repressor) of toxin-antitoxin stability system
VPKAPAPPLATSCHPVLFSALKGDAMDQYDIAYAREHLTELMEKAARGEDVSIVDPARGAFRLMADGAPAQSTGKSATSKSPNAAPPQTRPYDLTAPRVTDTMPKFMPLAEPRKLGQLEGIIPPPPDDFFDPLDEDELKLWYGGKT